MKKCITTETVQNIAMAEQIHSALLLAPNRGQQFPQSKSKDFHGRHKFYYVFLNPCFSFQLSSPCALIGMGENLLSNVIYLGFVFLTSCILKNQLLTSPLLDPML